MRGVGIVTCAASLLTLYGCSVGNLSKSASWPGGLPPSLPRAAVGAVRTVVIDPGHGGGDPGTSHYGLREKDLTLDIARRLRTALKAQGLNPLMTRERDRFIPLTQRAAIANRIPADIFISIHLNANRNRRVNGAEVYFPRASVVSRSAPWPLWLDTSEIGLELPTVKQVLWDMVLGRSRLNSSELASAICRTLHRSLRVGCRRKSARFVVLKRARMPAVLVEIGYVSNISEAKRLRSMSYREAAAQAIAEGVVRYIRGLGTQHI